MPVVYSIKEKSSVSTFPSFSNTSSPHLSSQRFIKMVLGACQYYRPENMLTIFLELPRRVPLPEDVCWKSRLCKLAISDVVSYCPDFLNRPRWPRH